MQDAIVEALISKLNPALYFIGLLFVLCLFAFGGTLLSLWWKNRQTQSDKLEKTLEGMRQAIGETNLMVSRVDATLELICRKYDKDLNSLGDKIRNLEV